VQAHTTDEESGMQTCHLDERRSLAASSVAHRLRLSRYHVCSDVAVVDGQRVRAVMATRTGEIVRVAAELWDQLVSGDLAGLPPEIVSELTVIELLVADEDELAVVLARSNAAIGTSDVLKLVVQPTAACQLDCVYCGQEHTSTKLCQEHQDAVVARTERQLLCGRYRTLSMGWFGAEPLLGMDVIRAMTPRLYDLAAAQGCSYNATVVTNGLRLTPEVATELSALHMSLVEVTIDGVGYWHDRQRPYKSGRSSFERIMRNVVDVARARPSFALSIRCNVTAESAPDIPWFIDMLDALGLQDGVDRVYFAPVHSWGNGAARMSLDKSDFARREIGWIAHLLRCGFRPSSLPKLKPVVCMATLPTAELVDAMGQIFNCTEVSYVPTYGSPNRYMIGDVRTGTDDRRRDLLADFNRRIADREVPCHSCHLLPVCGGSCPKAWREGEAACPSFKWYLPTRLLFELAPVGVDGRGSHDVMPHGQPDVTAVLEAFARAGTAAGAPAHLGDHGPHETPVTLRPSRAARHVTAAQVL
jgi:uncharacterized protein